MCACLPTYRPLFTRAAQSASSLKRRYYGSGTDSHAMSSGSSKQNSRSSKVRSVTADVLPLKGLNSSHVSAGDPHGDTVRLTNNADGGASFVHWEPPVTGRIKVESRVDVLRTDSNMPTPLSVNR